MTKPKTFEDELHELRQIVCHDRDLTDSEILKLIAALEIALTHVDDDRIFSKVMELIREIK